MKIVIEESYEALSKKAAEDLVRLVENKTSPLLCVPSGDTPVGLYKHLVKLKSGNGIDFNAWYFVSLDEWMGMNKKDEGSCTFYLNQQLLQPLKIEEQQTFLFDGRSKNPQQCAEMEAFIKQNNGIDVAILGLGLNGHIGMNEPGTLTSQRTHLSDIDILTQQTAQKYFLEPKQISQGLTLGIATLMEARHILLLVNGEKKAAIVKQVLEGPVSEKVPASLLRKHPSVSIYLDKAAAHLLTSSTVL